MGCFRGSLKWEENLKLRERGKDTREPKKALGNSKHTGGKPEYGGRRAHSPPPAVLFAKRRGLEALARVRLR